MSPKSKSQNSGQQQKGKRKSKRKAKSPLLESDPTSSATGTSTRKQRKNLSIENDFADSSNLWSSQMLSPDGTYIQPLNMNTNQQISGSIANCQTPMYFNQAGFNQAGYQTQQSPGFLSQPQAMSTPQSGPPPWAIQMLEELKGMRATMSKIENIEKTVYSIDKKVTDLDNKVQTLETRVLETEKACTFISQEADDQKTQLKGVKSECSKIHNQCKSLDDDIKQLKTLNSSMESKLIDQEMRSMRDNLIFFGIPETGSDENCETLVQQVCADHLKIENLTFDRVHRIGPRSSGKARPIVAKFHYYKERENVRKTSYNCSDALKRNNLGIGIQWPKQVRDTRKHLQPILEREKNKGNSVKLVRDKLYINGRPYNHQQD